VSRAAARVRALHDADPTSKVTDTGHGYEIQPPEKMSRLRAMWEGFKQLLPVGAQSGIGGMIGAGTVGAIQGGISPGTIQKRGRAMETARAENELARTRELESQGLENDSRRIQNAQR